MSVEGKEIICFQLLYQLINGNIKISEVSKDKLLFTYAQLKGFKEISGSIGIFDTSLLESIVSKAKKIISEEIEKRKQKDKILRSHSSNCCDLVFRTQRLTYQTKETVYLLLIHKEQDEGMAHSMPEDMGGLLLGVDVCSRCPR